MAAWTGLDHPRGAGRAAPGRRHRRGARRGLPRPHRRARPVAPRLPDRHRGRGARPGGGGRRAPAARRAAAAPRRHPPGDQGRALHARDPHHVRLEDPRGLRAPLRRDRHGAPGGGRRGPARQDEHGRVRDGLVHRELGLLPDPQPLGPRPRARRLIGRLGGGGRRATWRPAGSARTPAARCGSRPPSAASWGCRPTYGRVSRYGLIAFASSLDQIGPLTKDVRDAALLLEAIAGPDPMDSTSVDQPVPDYQAGLGQSVRGLTLGIPDEYFVAGLDPEVEGAVRAAIGVLERLGAKTRRVSLPHTDYGVAVYYIVAPAEASSNLARYDGVKYGHRAGGARDLVAMTARTRARGLRRRGQAPRHAGDLRALGRLLRGLLREGPAGAHPGPPRLRRARSPRWTPSWPRPRRRRRSSSARRPRTRWRCTSTTSSPSPSRSPACRPCRSRAASRPTGCRSGSSSSASRSTRRRCSASAPPTRPAGGAASQRWTMPGSGLDPGGADEARAEWTTMAARLERLQHLGRVTDATPGLSVTRSSSGWRSTPSS